MFLRGYIWDAGINFTKKLLEIIKDPGLNLLFEYKMTVVYLAIWVVGLYLLQVKTCGLHKCKESI